MPPELERRLASLNLGPVEYFDSIASTNDIAAERLKNGAPDLSLIVANQQTAGRGRAGRRWHTPPGAALAFSLVLRPASGDPAWAYAPLGALAVHEALVDLDLEAAIKWPNDVLLAGKKVCGVLTEVNWQGEVPSGVVLGIGVNVLPQAVPQGSLPFPATSVSTALGRRCDRWALMAAILVYLLNWRSRLMSPGFLKAWEDRLAFRGQTVSVGEAHGTLEGLAPDGSLQLQTPRGLRSFPAGELSLRPLTVEPPPHNPLAHT